MKKLVIYIAALMPLVFTGCKKKGCTDILSWKYDEDAEKDDGSCEYGGVGGGISIVAYPEHHGNPIVSSAAYPDSAFIKFNAINSPGDDPSAYDLVVSGTAGENHLHIPNLKQGKYFIFCTGFDSTLPPGSQRVSGGIPYTLTQSSGEAQVHVPVTEGD
jgi:hypothetical protein